ncbi:hypothetical protein ES288_D09G283700v1 [Gossypium darwinii]|uniref:Uncharacterized protein n=2 Tax=Gossypium TaxID=3633 RepID=A0A5D2JMT8_GOSTO|nr:hypothetical protein ES288_D09G283700v1 [Gossypium darwinii]TYH56088.1 hypothetical protein ES332_D09G283700v1 [Gossypium tomentosum]
MFQMRWIRVFRRIRFSCCLISVKISCCSSKVDATATHFCTFKVLFKYCNLKCLVAGS